MGRDGRRWLLALCTVAILGVTFIHFRLSGDSVPGVTLDSEAKHIVRFDFRHEESRHSTLCDVHSLLKRTRDETRYDVTVFDSCQRIFYNRVPKCGSRSVLSVFSELAKQNGFQVISLAKSRKYSLTDEDARRNLTNIFDMAEEPFVVAKHVHYIDFQRYGLLNPVYINVIRDPIERAISHFYYKLYGGENDDHPRPTRKPGLSFDDCIQKHGSSCYYVQDIVLPFFCGHAPICSKTQSNPAAMLARAKTIIRERYLVVGLTEDLKGFMEILEVLMPKLFRNATTVYKITVDSLVDKYRTMKKNNSISENTRAFLVNNMATEYELYKFVRQRYYSQLSHARLIQRLGDIQKIFQDNPLALLNTTASSLNFTSSVT